MATAQVESWVGVHRGSIESVNRLVDAAFADSALARMIIHRQRAVVARVIRGFLDRVGERFDPYLADRMPQAPVDPAAETANAKAAGRIVAELCGAPLPLLFERALLVAAEGAPCRVRADVDPVLAAYPGFIAAAILSARSALAASDPRHAIHALAAVEREILHLREGASLLADAVRAIGLHDTASRYDLTALLCRGGHDSRGNDCAPVDLTGKVINDIRMPQIYYFETQSDGTVLCNVRGVYYRVAPLLGVVLSMFVRVRPLA